MHNVDVPNLKYSIYAIEKEGTFARRSLPYVFSTSATLWQPWLQCIFKLIGSSASVNWNLTPPKKKPKTFKDQLTSSYNGLKSQSNNGVQESKQNEKFTLKINDWTAISKSILQINGTNKSEFENADKKFLKRLLPQQ